MRFEANLRRAMKKAKSTPRTLATSLGYLGEPTHAITVSRWMAGITSPRVATVPLIARALRTTVPELVRDLGK